MVDKYTQKNRHCVGGSFFFKDNILEKHCLSFYAVDGI